MSAGKHPAKLGRPCAVRKSCFRHRDPANAQLVPDQVGTVLETLVTPSDLLPVPAACSAVCLLNVEVQHFLIQQLSTGIAQDSARVGL